MSDDKPGSAGGVPAGAGPIAYGARANHVYEWIYQRILSSELAPGSFIDKTAIAAAIGVSKQPVTVALARLERDGWVEIESRVGSYVARIDTGVLRDVTEVWFAAYELVLSDAVRGVDPELAARLDVSRAAAESLLEAGRSMEALRVMCDLEVVVLQRFGNEPARGYQALFHAHMIRYSRHLARSPVIGAAVEIGRRDYIAAGLAVFAALQRGDAEAVGLAVEHQKVLSVEHVERVTAG
jgi:DNA-binding GntR family transcriptional regulator